MNPLRQVTGTKSASPNINLFVTRHTSVLYQKYVELSGGA